MKFERIIKVAFKNIKSNKLRSALTMLGLIIGIASVIVLVGIGNGASTDVSSQVQGLGTDVLTLAISSSDISIQYSQIDEILEINGIESVAPYKTVSATVSRGTTTYSRANIIATNNSYLEVTGTTISEGRNISVIDIENKSKICLLGTDIASTLFDLTDPVGQTIKLEGDNYTVVGILTKQGSSMGTNIDNTIIIPLSMAKYLGSDTSISNLYLKVENENEIDKIEILMGNYLRSTLQISSDYYSISSQDSIINTMEDINSTLSLLLGGIASISLIVGGIGVMNVMLVSVTERTKEIGIRKALGAKRLDILIQFLVEALVLSLLGGVLGILIGMLIGNILSNVGYNFSSNTTIVVLAFSSSALIGIIFGIFPAYRAASLRPIEALRTE